jgi:hypothetical protein
MGMTREEMERELAELEAAFPSQNPNPAMGQNAAPNRAALEAELAELEKAYPTPAGGFLHRAGQLARGIMQGTGGGADLIQPRNPALRPHAADPEQIGGIEYFFPEEAGQMANEAPHKPLYEELPRLTGLDERFEPEKGDTFGKGLNVTGNLLAFSPIPGGGYANAGKKLLDEGAKSALKALGKEAALSTGAAAAITATPRFTEEGTPKGALEDFAKGLFGMRAADTIVSKNLTKVLGRIPKRIGLSATTMGAKPNERAFGLAEKHGIDLPFNVGLRSKPANWMANNYLKSIFTSGVYEDALKNSNESMIAAVKRNIDSLGDSNLMPHEASGEYRRFIQAEEKAAEKAASKLYNEAAEILKKTDTVKPTHTAKFIEGMEELLQRDVQSPSTKKVANVVGNLAESWGIAPSGKTLEELEKNPKLIQAYLEAFKKHTPNIPIKKLIGVRKELGTITNFDPTIKGSESYLNGLKGAIDSDIQLTKNKAFLEKWRYANTEFKKNVADRFRGDIARSLLANEMPTEAFSLLNTPANIKELQKIVGNNPKAVEVFNALKKAKVREIFSNALQDESLRVTPFVNVFNKKEKTAEHLAALLPDKKTFNNLSEIAEIANEFKAANLEFLNTSRTALTASEIAKAEKLTKGVLSAFFNGAVGSGVGAMAGIGSAGGAAIGIAMPNLLSRLVANPQFVREARAYAIARKNGRQLYADTLLKRLIKLTDAESRLVMHEIRENQEKFKNE